MNLILLEPAELREDGAVTLTGARAAHLQRVLRVAPGQQVRVGLLDGPTGTARITSIDAASVGLVCAFDGAAPPRPRVDLLLALPRPKVMRRLFAQLAAIGVGRILLTNAARVERNYFDTHVLSPDGYRPLLLEGLQQARDTRVPLVTVHRQLKVLVEDELDRMFEGAVRLMADPGARTRPHEALGEANGARVLLAVGPEGGWNDFERELLARHGFRAIGAGPRTLRTDTACIALLALVHDALRQGA